MTIHLAGIEDKFRRSLVAEAHVIAREDLGEMQRRAPVDEGTLRGSAEADVQVGTNEVKIVFRFAQPYAARQHEELGYKHPRGGGAKYVESVLKERSGKLKRNIESAKRDATR